MRVWIAILLPLALLMGCASSPDLPRGTQAYAVFPAASADRHVGSYRIGPLDSISVTVFQEPDLSAAGLQVDTSGRVIMPIIGEVQAGGKTSAELAASISTLLKQHLLENPQVDVTVQDSVSQKVTVEGAVNEAGVFQIKGQTTLLDALAMAKGASRVAKLDQVAVFRTVNGKRVGALFDVDKINNGQSQDPEILGSDLIIVGTSGVRQAWLDVLTTSPLISAVRP